MATSTSASDSEMGEVCFAQHWPLDTDGYIDDELDPLGEEVKDDPAQSSRRRVRLAYDDERVRARFCANAQRLLDSVLQDDLHVEPQSAQIARKVLRYRNILQRLEGVDPRDPTFDVLAFFGVEWQRRDAQDEARHRL
ncbi:unnamed protein product [Phytophthora fragariaefolia]|uniref:Unnamed protein product n=1 Tax=Phytophthora fragariaefolia TaxID=1490495 RepID=A0A9W6TUA0_9STRA|nr:unnamed protein product [Phytophthora fragariaefolia]